MFLTWLDVWKASLTITVAVAIAAIAFLFTLPPAYSHFHPGKITSEFFTEQDRKNKTQSGWDYFQSHKDEAGSLETKTTVQVVVLGDIGRSPRMQYHALSLAKRGAPVQLIGYVDSEPHPDLLHSRFIHIIALPKPPRALRTTSRLLFPIIAPAKALFQAWTLYHALAYRTKASRFMLVQNPPSIPVLAIAMVICFFRNTRLIIDWHNLGYSILALRLGPAHPLVKLSQWYESAFSHAAHAHFTVTKAMQRLLRTRLGIEAVTLHDRPAEQFQPFTAAQRKDFIQQCEVTQPFAAELASCTVKLLVSSTSWTPDEDFQILLDALVLYSQYLSDAKSTSLPKLLVVITGKGPQKDDYLKRINKLKAAGHLADVFICTAWLDIRDYAALLASADLGICLHTSSSGVDLPMKVLDMFGSGLPVVGWNKYEAWSELVKEGVNGLGFESAKGLNDALQTLLGTDGHQLISKLREGALMEGKSRWEDEWSQVATKVFRVAT